MSFNKMNVVTQNQICSEHKMLQKFIHYLNAHMHKIRNFAEGICLRKKDVDPQNFYVLNNFNS